MEEVWWRAVARMLDDDRDGYVFSGRQYPGQDTIFTSFDEGQSDSTQNRWGHRAAGCLADADLVLLSDCPPPPHWHNAEPGFQLHVMGCGMRAGVDRVRWGYRCRERASGVDACEMDVVASEWAAGGGGGEVERLRCPERRADSTGGEREDGWMDGGAVFPKVLSDSGYCHPRAKFEVEVSSEVAPMQRRWGRRDAE